MPVDFLSPDEERSYGRYAEEPSADQLARYFHLDDADLERTARRRGDHNRFGFAIELATVRFLGTFLSDPEDVPPGVLVTIAHQLGLPPHQDRRLLLEAYWRRKATRAAHQEEIRAAYGYQDFGNPAEQFRLLRWLYERSYFAAERPSVLFDLATARLVERKVLLPGVTTLSRLVSSVRERAQDRLYSGLSRLLGENERRQLGQILEVDHRRQTAFDRLRRAPTRVSSMALAQALGRIEEIRSLGAGKINTSALPPSRLLTV